MNAWITFGAGLAIAIGALLPLQALINARLGQLTTGPLAASFISFLIGTLVLGSFLAATRTALPNWASISSQPPWLWLGGVIGALFVLSATVLVPRLGAGAMICLVIFGQLAGSLLLDHFGVLGSTRPVDVTRVIGAVLVLAGALLVVLPGRSVHG